MVSRKWLLADCMLFLLYQCLNVLFQLLLQPILMESCQRHFFFFCGAEDQRIDQIADAFQQVAGGNVPLVDFVFGRCRRKNGFAGVVCTADGLSVR